MLLPTERVVPGLGVGHLRFGMLRPDVRRFWGEPTEESSRGGTKYDFFAGRLCFVYYDPSGEAGAFEFGRGAVDLLYDGDSLFTMKGPELLRWVTSRDAEAKVAHGLIVSLALGLSIYAPLLEEEPDDPVEGIMVFREGAHAARDL